MCIYLVAACGRIRLQDNILKGAPPLRKPPIYYNGIAITVINKGTFVRCGMTVCSSPKINGVLLQRWTW